MVPSRFAERFTVTGAPRFALVASRVTRTNRALVAAAGRLGENAGVVTPADAPDLLEPGDTAVGRLDVLRSLDGVEPGLCVLDQLERAGVAVLNRPGALLAAHDKLMTALRLGEAGLPHPRTAHVDDYCDAGLQLPVVVKPRFGSWGRDVVVCRSRLGLRRCLRALRSRPWFNRQGALVQELVPPRGHDLRVVVAGGTVVGAIERVAARGEWRTNVALGGSRRAVEPSAEASLLALGAAHCLEADLAGIDLLPDGEGGYVVLEVNGAVDFTEDYSLSSGDVFERAVEALLATRYARTCEEEAEAVPFTAGARA
jgi:RimK family alpha-L-glutamate ligase